MSACHESRNDVDSTLSGLFVHAFLKYVLSAPSIRWNWSAFLRVVTAVLPSVFAGVLRARLAVSTASSDLDLFRAIVAPWVFRSFIQFNYAFGVPSLARNTGRDEPLEYKRVICFTEDTTHR